MHVGVGTTNEKIIVFTEGSINVCRAKKQIRDTAKTKKSKFDEIILPNVISNITGYHPSCYRSFCAITAKKANSIVQPDLNREHVQSERSDHQVQPQIEEGEVFINIEEFTDNNRTDNEGFNHPFSGKLRKKTCCLRVTNHNIDFYSLSSPQL